MSLDGDLDRDAAIAASLQTSWPPFFSRFGRLRPVQREAIPPILEGRDVLVIAPTASGKTEAACAPLVERNFMKRRWTVLYISPTRALVNDLFARIVGPVEQLGLSVRRRTGDHRDVVDDTPHFVITTPESFDSMLCRGRSTELGHLLGGVSAVVLDEIHLLHGGARGEQLRWLLERLRRVRLQMAETGIIRDPSVQVVALSATIADEGRIASEYLGPDPLIVNVPGTRPIDVVSPTSDLPDAVHAIPIYLRAATAPEKVLVFSNSRKRVDFLARELAREVTGLGYEVRAHHGSLAQAEREETEAAMKREDRIVVCATMTLEIGIDIGDVDLVVMDGPAPSITALLQRVGRGNRRTDRTRLMMCSGSTVEPIVHASMLAAARRGDLGQPEGGPQYAVARQQVASYIFQAPARGRTREQLIAFVGALLPTIDAAGLLDHLVQEGELEEDIAGLRLGADWLDRTTRGEIHANIEDAGGYEVADDRTGAPIGTGIRSQTGRGLGVAGKLLEVKRWDDFKILVRQVATESEAQGEWSYVSQAWMRGAGQPRAVQSYLGVDRETWPMLAFDGALCIFHFGGTRRRAVLELAGKLAGTEEILHLDDWTLWVPSDAVSGHQPPRWITAWTRSQLEILLGPDLLARMERLLARPRANRRLPVALRMREVVEWLSLDAEQAAFSLGHWSLLAPNSDAAMALGLIARNLRKWDLEEPVVNSAGSPA